MSASVVNYCYQNIHYQVFDISILIVCLMIIIACFVNKFYLGSRAPTLFDEVSNWPHETLFGSFLLTYIMVLSSIVITCLSVIAFSAFLPGVVKEIQYKPKRYILWNYIWLEVMLKVVNYVGSSKRLFNENILFLIWCTMFAPSICVFDIRTIFKAFLQAMLIVCALTMVTFLFDIDFQKKTMQKFLILVLSTYFILKLATIIIIVYGYPMNITGFTLVIFTLHVGLWFHFVLFIFSNHILVDYSKLGLNSETPIATDLYICVMHIFGRMLVLNTYSIFVEIESE